MFKFFVGLIILVIGVGIFYMDFQKDRKLRTKEMSLRKEIVIMEQRDFTDMQAIEGERRELEMAIRTKERTLQQPDLRPDVRERIQLEIQDMEHQIEKLNAQSKVVNILESPLAVTELSKSDQQTMYNYLVNELQDLKNKLVLLEEKLNLMEAAQKKPNRWMTTDKLIGYFTSFIGLYISYLGVRRKKRKK